MSGTRVDFSGMDNTASGIGTRAKTLEDRVTRMENDLKSKMSTWNGEAQAAYHVAQQRWNTAMRDLNAILNAVGIAVNDAGTGYRDTERLNQSAW